MARVPQISEKVDVLDVTKTHVVSVSSASSRTAAGVSLETAFITVHCDVDAYLVRGDETVEAAVPDGSGAVAFIPAGVLRDLPIVPGQYVALIAAEAGTARIEERL